MNTRARSIKTTIAGIAAALSVLVLVLADVHGWPLSVTVQTLLATTAAAALGALGLTARDADVSSEGAKVCKAPPLEPPKPMRLPQEDD